MSGAFVLKRDIGTKTLCVRVRADQHKLASVIAEQANLTIAQVIQQALDYAFANMEEEKSNAH